MPRLSFDFVIGLGDAIFYLQAVLRGKDSQHDYAIADTVSDTAARAATGNIGSQFAGLLYKLGQLEELSLPAIRLRASAHSRIWVNVVVMITPS